MLRDEPAPAGLGCGAVFDSLDAVYEGREAGVARLTASGDACGRRASHLLTDGGSGPALAVCGHHASDVRDRAVRHAHPGRLRSPSVTPAALDDL